MGVRGCQGQPGLQGDGCYPNVILGNRRACLSKLGHKFREWNRWETSHPQPQESARFVAGFCRDEPIEKLLRKVRPKPLGANKIPQTRRALEPAHSRHENGEPQCWCPKGRCYQESPSIRSDSALTARSKSSPSSPDMHPAVARRASLRRSRVFGFNPWIKRAASTSWSGGSSRKSFTMDSMTDM